MPPAPGPHVVAVNVGTPQPVTWTRSHRTAIAKQSVAGPVAVGRLGLAGDQVANTRHHGGPDQAVYAFAQEELEAWADVLGAVPPPGFLGENLTTRGLAVDDAEIGERWRLGTALLEVASVRTPCHTFATWVRRHHDVERWTPRFVQRARAGAYLRVLEEGHLAAGDAVEVVHRPGHGVTAAVMFRALHGEPALLPRLLEAPTMVGQARERALRHLSATSAAPGTSSGPGGRADDA